MNRADVTVLFDYLFGSVTACLRLLRSFRRHLRGHRETDSARLALDLVTNSMSSGGAYGPGRGPHVEGETELSPTTTRRSTAWQPLARGRIETRKWLAGLTDESLAADDPVENRTGYPQWVYLAHIATHGIQECTDAAALLTRAGHSPGTLGFLDFWDTRLRD